MAAVDLTGEACFYATARVAAVAVRRVAVIASLISPFASSVTTLYRVTPGVRAAKACLCATARAAAITIDEVAVVALLIGGVLSSVPPPVAADDLMA